MDDVNAPLSPSGYHNNNDFPLHQDYNDLNGPLPPIHVPGEDFHFDFDALLRPVQLDGVEERLPSIEEIAARAGDNYYDLQPNHFLDAFPSPRQSQSPFNFDRFLSAPAVRINDRSVPAELRVITFARDDGSVNPQTASHSIYVEGFREGQDNLEDSSEQEIDEDPFTEIDFPPTPQYTQEQTRDNEPIDLTTSSPIMPPTNGTRKRKRSTDNTPSTSTAAKASRDTELTSPKSKGDSVEVVDLEDIEEKEEYEAFKAKQQAEAIKRQNEEEANRPVRLADFQCIICMDQPTDLTVTHCGHLFCGECLHSALHAGDKKCCPVCRSTISTTLSAGRKPKSGIFPMQMKLMTAVRKGKQPAIV